MRRARRIGALQRRVAAVSVRRLSEKHQSTTTERAANFVFSFAPAVYEKLLNAPVDLVSSVVGSLTIEGANVCVCVCVCLGVVASFFSNDRESSLCTQRNVFSLISIDQKNHVSLINCCITKVFHCVFAIDLFALLFPFQTSVQKNRRR